MTSATGCTKILPSPISPVCAASATARTMVLTCVLYIRISHCVWCIYQHMCKHVSVDLPCCCSIPRRMYSTHDTRRHTACSTLPVWLYMWNWQVCIVCLHVGLSSWLAAEQQATLGMHGELLCLTCLNTTMSSFDFCTRSASPYSVPPYRSLLPA